jgi:GT2 family glycosyltransferase
MTRSLRDVFRHPLWAMQRASGELAARFRRSGAGAVVDAFRRASVARVEFRNRPMRRDPDSDDVIRWLGPLASGSRTHTALFAHPDAEVRYTIPAPARGRVTAWATLVPGIWDRNAGGVVFEVEAHRDGACTRAGRTVQPSRRWTDRRWLPLGVALPPSNGPRGDVEVVLRTRLPPTGDSGHAWAVWGDPAVEWPLGFAHLRAAATAFWQRVRESGLRDTVRQLREGREGQSQALFVEWMASHTPDAGALARMAANQASWPRRPLISVVTPVYNTPPALLRAAIGSVMAQAYPNWELCLCDDASTSAATRDALAELTHGDARIKVARLEQNGGISAASNAALALATGEFVVLLDHDDELAPEALYELAALLNAHPDADVVYSDYDKLDEKGARVEPYFKPDWSPELLLSYMYLCHMSAARRSLIDAAGGFRVEYAGAQDYDLFLRLTERTTRIHHIPQILYHWRKVPGSTAATPRAKTWATDAGRAALADAVARRGWHADVLEGKGPGFYRVRRRLESAPLVSILVPTRGGGAGPDGRDILAECLGALASRTTYRNYELVIASDSGRVSGATARAIAGTRHRIVHYDAPPPFNFSRKTNFAAAAAEGSQLVLFNDDVEVTTPEWIESLLEWSAQEDIGAVGAKLYFPDGRLQHVGMLLGVAGIAAHAFYQYPGSTPGYFGSTIVTANMSAVTAALMMTRRDIFRRMGGFNEALPIDFNDVDYCLKLRRAGFRIVFTPWAEAFHHESVSFGPRTQDPDRIAEMRRLWGPSIEWEPYLNVHLSREFPDYRISNP